MTVASEINHNQYVGNGVTTSFDYGFRIFKNSHLLVQVSDLDGVITTLVLGTDYTVSGVGASGGKVVLTAPLSTGWAISIDRNLPIVQETDLRNQGTFYAETHEDAFDYLTMLIQRVYSYFTLALRKPSWLAKFYDAQGNRISNLSDPVKPQDAVTKNYSDSQAQANLGKTLRVPDSFIAPLPSISSMEGTVIGIVNGRPVGVPVPSGSAADVLIQLAKPSGAGLIGNGNDTVNNFLYHTPEEFNSGNMDTALAASLAATASDGRRTWIKGNKSLAVTASVPQGVIVQNDGAVNSSASVSAFTTGNGATITGGKITTSSPVTAVRAWAADGVKVNHITANGSVLSNTPAAYALSSTSKDFNVSGVALSGYTGGIELSGTNRAVINGIKAEKMWFHASLGAGGYGVLLQGAVDSFITNLHFVAGAETSADGYNGRHGVYQSVLSGSGSVNTIVNGYIANYRDKTTASPGAINIRSNNRAVYSNMIIDNAHISGNLEDGDISNQIVSNAVIRNTKVTTSPAYGVDLGSSVSGNYVRSSLVSNAIISVQPATGISTDNCNGLVVSGKNGLMNGVIINVPELSYPLTVRAGVDNYLINGIIDYNSSGGGQSFILFDGACSNIKISGCKTGRRWFRAGNLTAVTNLTVDFPRSVIGSLNAGNPTYSDFYELVSTTSVSSTNIVITFNTHVTQAALDSAIATVVKAGVMAYPVIVSRSNKSLIIEFYSLAGGSIINPTSNAISFMINISC